MISKTKASEKNNPEDLSEESGKILNRIDRYMIGLTNSDLVWQLNKRIDTFALKFSGDGDETSDLGLKTLAKAIGLLKKVRRLDLQFKK